MFLVILAVVISVWGLMYPVHQDEAVFMEVGQGMVEGKLFYRDFSDFKPPGIYGIQFLVSSFEFQVKKLDGDQWLDVVMITRLLVIGVNLVSAGMIWLIGREVGVGREGRMLMALSYLILLQVYQGQFGLTEPWMAVFLLGGVWLLMRWGSGITVHLGGVKAHPRGEAKEFFLIFFGGMGMGMAMMFKQAAVVNVIAISFWLLVVSKHRVSWVSGISRVIALGLGMMAVWLPVVIWFVNQGIWDDFWRVAVIYPLTEYPPLWQETVRQLPVMLWPIAVWIILVRGIWGRVGGEIRDSRDSRNLVVRQLLWLMQLLPLSLVLSRPYHHYWLQVLPFVIISVAISNRKSVIGNWKLGN